MGQTIGTVQTKKLSDNEFSFEWKFCKVNFDFSYRSPKFEFTYKKFSRCYLEMTPNIINRVLTFSMCGCQGGNGLKISSIAVLADSETITSKSKEYEASLDLEPSMKVFEIHLSDPMLSKCFNYTFKLHIKLHSDLSLTLNENSFLQSSQDTAISRTSFHELSTSTKSLECTTTSSTSFSEISTSTKHFECERNPSTSLNEDLMNTKHLDRYSSNAFYGKPTSTGKASSSACKNKSRSAPNFERTKELVEDFRCLYTSENMSDLEIRIGGDVLYAHKLILSTRSPVFKKMMEQNCFESSSSSVTITDCPIIPFKKFLKYLYTGEIEDGTIDTMMSLYSLGEKYNVKALPEACSDILQNKLSCEPVDDVASIICDVLQLSACHGDIKLQDLSESFIINHFPEVSQKQNWKDLMKSNSELTSKILAFVVAGLQKVQT